MPATDQGIFVLMTFDAATIAQNLIFGAVMNRDAEDPFDLDAILHEAFGAIAPLAQTATADPNTHDPIIAQYPNDAAADLSQIHGPVMFRPSEWMHARRAYAYAIAFRAIERHLKAESIRIAEAAEVLVEQAWEEEQVSIEEVTIRASLPSEKDSRKIEIDNERVVLYWDEHVLDGKNGMAIQVGHIWLFCIWEPK